MRHMALLLAAQGVRAGSPVARPVLHAASVARHTATTSSTDQSRSPSVATYSISTSAPGCGISPEPGSRTRFHTALPPPSAAHSAEHTVREEAADKERGRGAAGRGAAHSARCHTPALAAACGAHDDAAHASAPTASSSSRAGNRMKAAAMVNFDSQPNLDPRTKQQEHMQEPREQPRERLGNPGRNQV